MPGGRRTGASKALAAITLPATLPFVLAGLGEMFRFGFGLYWAVPGVVLSLLLATVTAWTALFPT
jgi:hypothetical protein